MLDANLRINVTGARAAQEIAEHICDSLSVIPYVREPYVDIGSGAGFPAIPVAIAAGIAPTMIEATAKKARLLESMLRELDLRGNVVAARAEVAGRDPALRDHFASGTARALGSAGAVVELLLPFLTVGGTAVLQRGRMEPSEQAALEDAAAVLGATLEAETKIGGNRRILLIRKRLPTPARFPRRTGVAQKRPLCE